MGLNKELNIPELYRLKHRNDRVESDNKPVDIEVIFLKNALSPFIYKNPQVSKFLNKFNKLVYILFNQMYIMKNFKNFTVNKYYDKGID